MKIKVDSRMLKSKIKLTAVAAIKEDKMGSVWTCIRLQAKAGKLILTGGNPGCIAIGSMPAEIAEEGDVMVPMTWLENVSRYLEDGQTSLATVKNSLEIRCGDLKMNAPLSTDEFHDVKDGLPSAGGVEVETEKLKKGVAAVSMSARREADRPILGGVQIEFFPEGSPKIQLIATDGLRMGAVGVPVPKVDGSIRGKSVVIPAAIFEKILGAWEGEKTARIVLYDGRMLIGDQNDLVILNALSGSYPDVKPLVPKTSKVQAAVDLTTMLRGLRFGREVGENGTIDFKTGKTQKSLVLRNESDTSGKNEAKVKANAEGEERSVYINFRFVQEAVEAIRKMDYSGVVVSVNEKTTPVKLEPVRTEADKDKLAGLFLVMPMNRSEAVTGNKSEEAPADAEA